MILILEIVHNGAEAYKGTLTLGNLTVTACECSDAASTIYANRWDGRGAQRLAHSGVFLYAWFNTRTPNPQRGLFTKIMRTNRTKATVMRKMDEDELV
ncbi:MAG: hypothetical protein ACOYZ8_19265 [Chloroflexota bacterium]